MARQLNCQSDAWGVLTQYSLAVTAFTLILLLMLLSSSGKKFTTVKTAAMSFTSFRYKNHRKVLDVIFWNGNNLKKL